MSDRFSPNKFNFNNEQSTMYIFIAVGIVFLLSQAFTVIDPGYRGVSVTLGKVSPNFRSEGPAFKMPFIENIVKVPIKQITTEGVAECYSSDLQTVKVHYKALHRIPEGRVVELLRQIQGNPYDALVEPRIQDALKQVTARYRAEDLVKNREEVKRQAIAIIRATLKLEMGADTSDLNAEKIKQLNSKSVVPWVYVEDLPISNIDLTDELEKAIELKQIKEQEALAKEYELRKATKQAEIVIVEAGAVAKAIEIKGKALRMSPDVIELEIAKKWDGKTPTTVVVGKGGGNVLLPLR